MKRIRQRGATTMETALLFPVLMGVGLAVLQLMVYLQSASATQYAAFAAARAYQVYGSRQLHEIEYPHVAQAPLTHRHQSIVEATAEKIIFESLLWENRHIQTQAGHDFRKRFYRDGVDVADDGSWRNPSRGRVLVNFVAQSETNRLSGVQVTYCMPVLFPGLDKLFARSKEEYPCQVTRFGLPEKGIAVKREVALGREPVEL